MAHNKSLDEISLIVALLHDAHSHFGEVFNTRVLRNTTKVVIRRYRLEGIGLLTKTFARLGKHFDQALAGEHLLDASVCRFAAIRGTKLPRFLGELFKLVFNNDGTILATPNAQCVRLIRDILYAFYKLELPYDASQEQEVCQAFKQAEADLSELDKPLAEMRSEFVDYLKGRHQRRRSALQGPPTPRQFDLEVVRGARKALHDLFLHFDPLDITPSHGPGVVATKQRLWDKFRWTNVSRRITDMYPFDAYFCASVGHVCDTSDTFSSVTEEDLPARVLLVPKDSRGPRLISCEPVDFQWVQQGLSRAIVRWVERSALTKHNVFFTDQGPNQRGAIQGSKHGGYATLDLKEASDRVHLDLVRLLFPSSLIDYLEASRSLATELPTGEVIPLRKFAPMGSALCFPIMALTIWSLLTAAADNAQTRECLYVYGDDIIVPTAYAASAMTLLERFGLRVNRAKSCTKGFFRESCGVDAFHGTNVTPVRIRTVWDDSPRPDVYTSYIATANSYLRRRYYTAHELIVSRLLAIYGKIPDKSMWSLKDPPCPCLDAAPAEHSVHRSRWNKRLQKREFLVRCVSAPSVNHEMDGWSMLLRYFTEGQKPSSHFADRHSGTPAPYGERAFSVSRYTKRDTSMLVSRWR